MKRVLPIFVLFSFFVGLTTTSTAQQGTVEILCEDFEDNNWNVITYSIPATGQPGFERVTDVTYRGTLGAGSDTIGRNNVTNRARSYLQTPNLYIDTFNNVSVQFAHICYISDEDEMKLQYSFNGGASWITCTRNEYTGNSFMLQPGNFFNKKSRAIAWKYQDPNGAIADDTSFIWNNTNSVQAWAVETFNIRDVLDRTVPKPDSVMFRVELYDLGVVGRVGDHRYYIDDFCVRGSNCEAIPPTIARFDTMDYSSTRYEGRVYWEGPYEFNTQLTDASTIDTAYLEYYVYRKTDPNLPMTEVLSDTIPLVKQGNTSFYNNSIPRSSTQIGDSVFWKISVFDASPCRNARYYPSGGGSLAEFEVRSNKPKTCDVDPLNTFPYVETFDSRFPAPQGQFVAIDGWVNAEGDFNNWLGNSGITPTTGTGPSDDIPGGGKYLYVESTNKPDSLAVLLSPCFDLFDMPNGLVRFYLHQNTTGGDTVFLDVFDPTPVAGFPDGRFVNDVIAPVSGNKGDNWLPYEFSTYQYSGKVIQLRFRGLPDKLSDISDIALDSFKIEPAAIEDMRADRIIIPPFMPEGETDNVEFIAQNQGIFDVTSLKLNYQIIMAADSTVYDSAYNLNWTGLIQPGQFVNITLSDSYIVPRGQYFIKAWLEHPGDEVITNDTTIQATRGLAYKQIYYRDFFDDEELLFTTLTDEVDELYNFWEHGEPKFDKTNRAFSLPYAWDINLVRPYTGAGSTIQLVSPFLDFSNAQDVFLSFFNNRDIDTAKDGVYLQYSLDQGRTWETVPELGDPNRLKWYNSYLADPSFGGQFVFSGITRYIPQNWHNWIESEIMLPSIFDNQPLVLLRFNFFAEEGLQSNDGMSIDNFLVYDRKPLDVEPQFIMQPRTECDMTSTERFKVAYKNRGEQTFNSFDVEYVVTNLESGNTQRQFETINRTINPRDTIYHLSTVTFDMRELGDYLVTVITNLQNDGYAINDTLSQTVENIDGCYLMFEAITGAYKRPAIVDSSFWRFEYTSGDREYVVTDDYRPFDPVAVNERLVCIKKNSFVKFTLGDMDTTIVEYSLYAYDGEEDTILVDRSIGGTSSPTRFFNWICPPDSSAETIDILIDNNVSQFPISKAYNIATLIRNDGLDSIQTLEVGLSIDGQDTIRTETFVPPFEYAETDTMNFGLFYLSPGRHVLKGWVHAPNGNQDERPENDTFTRVFMVIDTAYLTPDYCTNFELVDDSVAWLGLNFETTYQDSSVSFEWNTPSNAVINSAYSGTKAWVTNADSDYNSFDNSALISPFIELEKDSCYKLSFYHNYLFDDLFHDGGHVRISTDTANSWTTLNGKLIGVGDTLLQEGWYNTTNIASIPDNSQNSGWTGNSGGWVKAQTVVPAYEDAFALFAFRLGSDGNNSTEGWAVDDFCFEKIETDVSQKCFAVGLDEENLDPSKLYLGQNQPNPALNQTQIPYYLPKSGAVNFSVTNMMGQTVYQSTESKSSGNHLMQLDISDLGSGIYYYWIIFDEVKIAKKMIITR
tara:strand:- start:734 stop:5272 length:4539 start_codon:yes stop_codon:yes gene_type:complete